MVLWNWVAASEWQETQAFVISSPEVKFLFRISIFLWSVVVHCLLSLTACLAKRLPMASSPFSGVEAKTGIRKHKRVTIAVAARPQVDKIWFFIGISMGEWGI